MIFASRSGDSSASKRMPLTVPAVPTGIKTGVSMRPRRVVNTPARASPSFATTSNRNAVGVIELKKISRKGAKKNSNLSLRLCAFAGKPLVFLDDSQRRREEVKLLAQAIHEVPFVGEVQSGFAAGRKNHESRRSQTNLRQVLNMQPRKPAFCRRRGSAAAWLRDRFFKEIVEL